MKVFTKILFQVPNLTLTAYCGPCHVRAKGGLVMTANQLAYQANKEKERSNRVQEEIGFSQASAAHRQARASERNAATNETNAMTNKRNARTRELEFGETMRHNTRTENLTEARNTFQNMNDLVKSIGTVVGLFKGGKK